MDPTKVEKDVSPGKPNHGYSGSVTTERPAAGPKDTVFPGRRRSLCTYNYSIMFKFNTIYFFFFYLFALWLFLASFDLATGHAYALAPKLTIVLRSSVGRLGNFLAFVRGFVEKYRWFAPVLVFAFLVSPFLGVAFLAYDVFLVVYILVVPRYRASITLAPPSLFYLNPVNLPVFKYLTKKEEEEEDSDDDSSSTVSGEYQTGAEDNDDQILVTSEDPAKVNWVDVFPAGWERKDVDALNRLTSGQKKRLSGWRRTDTPRRRPIFLSAQNEILGDDLGLEGLRQLPESS